MVLAEIGTAGVISAYFFRHMTSGYSLNVSDPIKGQPVQLSYYLCVFGCGLVFWLLVLLWAKLHDSGDRQADIREIAKLAKLIAPITTLNLCGCLLVPFMKLPLLVRFLVLFQVSSNLALLLIWAFLSLKECMILPNAHTQQQQKSSPEPQAGQLQMSIGRQQQMSIGQQLASSFSNRPKRRGQLFMDAIQGMIKPVEVCGSFRSGSGASGREENRGRYGGNDGGGGAGGGGDRGASGSGHGSGASGSGGGSEGGDRGSDRGGDRGASGSGHGSGASGSGGGSEGGDRGSDRGGDRGASGSGHGSGASGSGGGNECGDRGSDGGGDRGASGSGHGSGASGSGGGSEGGDRGRDGGGAEPECGGRGTNKEQAFESSKIIKMSIMLTAQTTGTLIGFHSIPTPSSSSKVLLVVALMDQLVAYLCGVTGLLLISNKPEDSKAANIFARIGFVCSTLGYILTIAMYVTPYFPWYSVLIVVLLFGVVWLILFRERIENPCNRCMELPKE